MAEQELKPRHAPHARLDRLLKTGITGSVLQLKHLKILQPHSHSIRRPRICPVLWVRNTFAANQEQLMKHTVIVLVQVYLSDEALGQSRYYLHREYLCTESSNSLPAGNSSGLQLLRGICCRSRKLG